MAFPSRYILSRFSNGIARYFLRKSLTQLISYLRWTYFSEPIQKHKRFDNQTQILFWQLTPCRFRGHFGWQTDQSYTYIIHMDFFQIKQKPILALVFFLKLLFMKVCHKNVIVQTSYLEIVTKIDSENFYIHSKYSETKKNRFLLNKIEYGTRLHS